MLTIPNLLTIFRIALIPLFIVTFYSTYSWSYITSASIFTLAAVTDWLDGYLARRLAQTSRFGAFLDPVADKLIVIAALVLLIQTHSSIWLTIPALIIISREITVSALREWMADIGKRASVAVSHVGKVKTVFQMLAMITLLANPAEFSVWVMLGYLLLYIAAILTLWSMLHYLKAAWQHLSE